MDDRTVIGIDCSTTSIKAITASALEHPTTPPGIGSLILSLLVDLEADGHKAQTE